MREVVLFFISLILKIALRRYIKLKKWNGNILSVFFVSERTVETQVCENSDLCSHREIFELDNYSPIPVETEDEYKLVVSRFPFHDAEIEKVMRSSTTDY